MNESEETLKKNKLGPKERGRILYGRLQELERTGKLSTFTSRSSLAKEVGAKYSWVRGMISNGYLVETITGFNNGIPEYCYYISDKHPDYTYNNVGRKKVSKKEVYKHKAVPSVKEIVETPGLTELPVATLKIDNKEIHITIENISIDNMIKIISTIC